MKCPKCQAKLLPVDGVMFCLQCGNAVAPKRGADMNGPDLEETTDPILQRAIVEASDHEVHFKLPHSNVGPPKPVTAMTTMTAVLGGVPKPALAVAGGGTLALPAPPVEVDDVQEANVPEPKVKLKRKDELNLLFPKPAKVKAAVPGWLKLKIAPSYMVGAVVFAVFVLANAGIYAAYAGRVYPGVKVDGVVLGGSNFDQVADKVNRLAKQSPLSVEVGSRSIQLDTKGLAEVDVAAIERQAEAIGHSTPLPLAGLLEAELSSPIHAGMSFNQGVLERLVGQIKGQIDRASSDAVPLIYNGQAFVISEKSGEQLDGAKLAAGIKQAYGTQSNFQAKPNKVEASITTSSYANELQDTQTMLSLGLHIVIGKNSYTPNSAQIGSWLGFSGPGKGVVIDSAAVAAYVNGLPGTFDKDGATKALIAAVQGKQPLTYNAAAKKTNVPAYAVGLPVPVKTYSYCISTDKTGDLSGFKQAVAASLAQNPGWTLGGKIAFKEAGSGCNFSLALAPANQMATYDTLCKFASSCLSGNTILFSDSAWVKPPATWKGTVGSYQLDLVNHEVGHWLGFEHASCTVAGSSQPILAQPTVVLGGCSPQWFEIPAEVQGTKALAQL